MAKLAPPEGCGVPASKASVCLRIPCARPRRGGQPASLSSPPGAASSALKCVEQHLDAVHQLERDGPLHVHDTEQPAAALPRQYADQVGAVVAESDLARVKAVASVEKRGRPQRRLIDEPPRLLEAHQG